MRKIVLVSIVMSLLALTLLPTAPAVAKKPEPEEMVNVTVSGDVLTDGVVTLDIRRAGRLVIVYGPACMSTDLTGTGWDDFEDGHQLGIRIYKSGETEIIYTFGTSDFEGKGWPKYRLMGPGIWSDESIPYGTVSVTEETFTIEEMSYERKGKKGAIGVTYNKVWDDPLTFTITIEEA